MIKEFVCFEGIETVSKNRRKLINKTSFSTVSKNPWVEFSDFIAKKYDFDKIEHIYFMSDAGNWLKSGFNELKMTPNNDIKFLLCEFHFKQALNHISKDQDFRKEMFSTFKDKPKNEFITLINNYKEKHPERNETIEKKLNYILNNYNPIKDMLDFEIGSSMESHISHNLARTFASRPKGYSSLRIDKYLKLNDYKNNGYNIFNLYLNSYMNDEVRTVDDKEISFSIFENNSSNVPILDNPNNSQLYNAINNLCHNAYA